MRRISALLLLMLNLSVSWANEKAFPVTGIFSDLSCTGEEGDILGLEVIILAGHNAEQYKHFALVQFAEGVSGIPQLVPIQLDGNKIQFTVNYLGQFDVKFSGTVTTTELVGKFSQPLANDIQLPRQNSFWQNPGDSCFR
ncbi:MAG: hypothetical protein ACU83U_09275 [Gammaproteobacteria bacterium]